MSLYAPRKTCSSKVRIFFSRESLEDDWELDEIQGSQEIEPPSGRSEHDWVWDFATCTVNENHFFEPGEVEGALKVVVTGVLEGWWSSTTDGEDYDEEFEVEKLEKIYLGACEKCRESFEALFPSVKLCQRCDAQVNPLLEVKHVARP